MSIIGKVFIQQMRYVKMRFVEGGRIKFNCGISKLKKITGKVEVAIVQNKQNHMAGWADGGKKLFNCGITKLSSKKEKANISLIQNQQNICHAIQKVSKKSLRDQEIWYGKEVLSKQYRNKISDIAQYVIPASYMTGALLLPGGMISMSILNMSVLTFNLMNSIGMYSRAIESSGSKLSDVFKDEAIFRANGGGKSPLSSSAVNWRRGVSVVTAAVGLGLSVGAAVVFGTSIGAMPYIVLGINTLFPSLNYILLTQRGK